MKTKKRINEGDRVYWISHSPVGSTRKTGHVVSEVCAGLIPCKESWSRWRFTPKFSGKARTRRSFLVAVTTGPKAKPRLYWPRTAQLRLAGGR